MEERFACLIWDNAPISSGELVRLCEKELCWKKSTTYTMLRRLCDRSLFKNDGGTVSPCITRQEFLALQSEAFVQDAFDGSLPKFLAAFSSRSRLSEGEIDALQTMINRHRDKESEHG